MISDSVFAGGAEDKSGALLVEMLTAHGMDCLLTVVPDEIDRIRAAIETSNAEVIITTGGTGVGPRDVTPEAVEPLLEKRLAGVEEAYRAYSLTKTPFAMLSRSLAGIRKGALILCLPGSPKAVRDAVDCLFPAVLHVFEVQEGMRHD